MIPSSFGHPRGAGRFNLRWRVACPISRENKSRTKRLRVVMIKVEGLPSVEPAAEGARLVLPCTKYTFPLLRDYALNREQLTALIASGIDALDRMDLAQL